eukprot:COSAG05_NODE_2949_length_2474_cov_1.914947_2_plen_270_part_00
MNRAVYLLRPDSENSEDLHRTALELVRGASQDGINGALIAELPRITEAYIQMLSAERRDPVYSKRSGGSFSGLRDFYSFVKLLEKQIRRGGGNLTSEILLHSIFRSFGGFREHTIGRIVAEPFWSHCSSVLQSATVQGSDAVVKYRSDNILELLRANLSDVTTEKSDTGHGEIGARHLMILSQQVSSAKIILENEGVLDRSKVSVLCGSPFDEDQSSLQMFRQVRISSYTIVRLLADASCHTGDVSKTVHGKGSSSCAATARWHLRVFV